MVHRERILSKYISSTQFDSFIQSTTSMCFLVLMLFHFGHNLHLCVEPDCEVLPSVGFRVVYIHIWVTAGIHDRVCCVHADLHLLVEKKPHSLP